MCLLSMRVMSVYFGIVFNSKYFEANVCESVLAGSSYLSVFVRRCDGAILRIHIYNFTHTEDQTEATGSERREFALNGKDGRWMGRVFCRGAFFEVAQGCGLAQGWMAPLLLAMLLRIRCTKMMRTWTRLATSGRNSVRRLLAGSRA